MMCRRWRASREGTPALGVVHDEAELNEASGLVQIVREAPRQMLAVVLHAEVSAHIDSGVAGVNTRNRLWTRSEVIRASREIVVDGQPRRLINDLYARAV